MYEPSEVRTHKGHEVALQVWKNLFLESRENKENELTQGRLQNIHSTKTTHHKSHFIHRKLLMILIIYNALLTLN